MIKVFLLDGAFTRRLKLVAKYGAPIVREQMQPGYTVERRDVGLVFLFYR